MGKALASRAESHKDFLTKRMDQVKSALPSWITPDRMLRVVLTQFNSNPALLECEEATVYSCMMQCAQLGLEPGGVLGHAYFIPFRNSKKGCVGCTLIIGYKGLIDLARRSGEIISISARVVHEKDKFDYSYGLEDKLEHVPATGDRGKPIYVYAVAKLKGGGNAYEVMTVGDINKIRDGSPAAKRGDSPWKSYWGEMARKTVVRRLFKYLPASVIPRAAHDAIHREDEALYVESEVISDATRERSDDLRHRLENATGGEEAPKTPEVVPPIDPKPEADKPKAKKKSTRTKPAEDKPPSEQPFEMTAGRVFAIEEASRAAGLNKEELDQWIQDKHVCSLSGIPTWKIYDEIVADLEKSKVS